MHTPAAQPYGPNTPAVRAFLRDLARQPPAAWARAARVYGALRTTESFARADAALGGAIENASLGRARDALVGPLVQLANGTALRLAGGAPAAPPGADQLAESALAAALALLARDLIAGDLFDALYAPFAELVPPPR